MKLKKEKSVEDKRKVCSVCKGSGWKELGEVVCPECKGSGRK